MPDINQQDSVPAVQRRLEGQPQSGGKESARGQVPKKVVENYQEVAKTQPFDDRITILGIPVEQITPVTQAALAGLVAEINHLRNVVKRYEKSSDKRGHAKQSAAAILEPEEFHNVLGATLAQSPGEGMTWVTVLVHVSTYEDIRRSSGLLAANSTLADVAYRLRDVRLDAVSNVTPLTPDVPPASAPVAVPFVLIGYVGGSNLAGVTALPSSELDSGVIGNAVKAHLTASGYTVGGIDMALAISTAATPVGQGESPLLALGRVDHLLRTG
jgi:hypothetical protein